MKIIVLAMVASLGFILYHQWGWFVISTVEWQKTLHTMLASHISAVSEDAFKYGGALVALSFAYGVFHAVGPGHGKAVIVTYLGTHKESVWKGITISFSAAILQSVIAVALVSVLARVLKLKLVDVQGYGNDMATVSYVLIILLGFLLLIGAAWRLIRHRYPRNLSVNHATREGALHQHSHHHDCGCSHTHIPERQESIWQTLGVILSMGIRPCSGAIVVLIYAHLVGVYAYGVMATLMMGAGTGLSVSLIAIGTLYARSLMDRFVSGAKADNVSSNSNFTLYLRGLGGIILLALGWSLYSAASATNSGHPLF